MSSLNKKNTKLKTLKKTTNSKPKATRLRPKGSNPGKRVIKRQRVKRPRRPRTRGEPISYSTHERTSKAHTLRLTRREYLQDIVAPGADVLEANTLRGVPTRSGHFVVSVDPNGLLTLAASIAINWGLKSVFPWMSKTANSFEQYIVNHCFFDYAPSCPTTSTGQIAASFVYNVDDPLPTTKVQMNDRDGCQRSNIYHPLNIKLDKKEAERQVKFHQVRNGPILTGDDLRLYDAGRLDILVTGVAPADTNTVLGELWVDSDITLAQPHYDGVTGDPMDTYIRKDSFPFLSTDVHYSRNDLGVVLSPIDYQATYGISVKLPGPGLYMLNLHGHIGAGGTVTHLAAIPSPGVSLTEYAQTNTGVVQRWIAVHVPETILSDPNVALYYTSTGGYGAVSIFHLALAINAFVTQVEYDFQLAKIAAFLVNDNLRLTDRPTSPNKRFC